MVPRRMERRRSASPPDACLADPSERRLGSMAKPLKCRLKLHIWERRENPETHDHYEVCVRCDAYRDRGSAAPGAGAAGAMGASGF